MAALRAGRTTRFCFEPRDQSVPPAPQRDAGDWTVRLGTLPARAGGPRPRRLKTTTEGEVAAQRGSFNFSVRLSWRRGKCPPPRSCPVLSPRHDDAERSQLRPVRRRASGAHLGVSTQLGAPCGCADSSPRCSRG
eukprot:scaffold1778_cov246-Pinguiococcus_pyrenoidosus.AAC.11